MALPNHSASNTADRTGRTYILEVPTGLEDLAAQELNEKLHLTAEQIVQRKGELQISWRGKPALLLALHTLEAVYIQLLFPVPRPKALLGDQNFRLLTAAAREAMAGQPDDDFETIVISAAGRGSAVLRRLHEQLAAELGLIRSTDRGDLLVRLRRPGSGDNGWEALLRIGSRPLSTRTWRICNLEGALNGPVAHAMVRLARPRPTDAYLNIGCGSGTLIIERLLAGPIERAIAVDIQSEALSCAVKNMASAGISTRSRLVQADSFSLPLKASSFDVVVADLPFGNLVGSHQYNLKYYPAVLAEARRVIKPAGRAVLITHEARLLERLLPNQSDWRVMSKRTVSLRGLHPRLYLLKAI